MHAVPLDEADNTLVGERPEPPVQIFIARQPLLGLNQRVYGYELLYRSSHWNAFDGAESSRATIETLADALMTIGLARLVGNSYAFINASRAFLLSQVPLLLPARRIIFEVPETVGVDEPVIARCRDLKRLGFQIAIDDVTDLMHLRPLIGLADLIKVDFRLATVIQQERIAAQFRDSQVRLVAQKIESRAEFERACRFGYTYFQGYFFQAPAVLTANRLSSQRSTYVHLLAELSRKELDYSNLERLFKHDPVMTYRLLRYLNSALFSWTSPIRSLRQALSLLGDDELRRWLGLLGLASLAEGRPSALIVAAAVRGRFCELLGSHVRLDSRSAELFLMGLLSLFDTLLQCPMEGVLDGLSLSTDVCETLMGLGDETSRLSRTFDLTLSWERADWDRVTELGRSLDIDMSVVADTYAEAVEWADRLCDVDCLSSPAR
ncbi:MAG TPA: HDOD domain-containing protein [Bryobacteraceae bacterium]|nr:HDOD domain-containing protein [Bryobacteraceae bacterium]